MAKKTSCPITRAQFRAHAKPIEVKIGDRTFTGGVKEFSTGSLGWNVNEKTTIEIDGKPVSVQVGLNLTIVGSKDLPRDEVSAAGAASSSEAVV
jgi:hypothetical protein